MMETGFTFGSFGDIVAVCQVANQLRQALGVGSSSESSAKDYQDLRKDLERLVQVLTHASLTNT
jgi:hypothetical protein